MVRMYKYGNEEREMNDSIDLPLYFALLLQKLLILLLHKQLKGILSPIETPYAEAIPVLILCNFVRRHTLDKQNAGTSVISERVSDETYNECPLLNSFPVRKSAQF